MDELEVEFQNLRSLKAESFDPVGFAYIQGLYSRFSLIENRDNAVLRNTVLSALAEYRERYQSQRERAGDTLAEILACFPDYGSEAELLLAANEFKQLEQLFVRLERAQHSANRLEELRSLVGAVNDQFESDAEMSKEDESFENLLKQQEQSILDINHSKAHAIEDGSGEQLELQSMRFFRESTKHTHIDSLLERAINECPANPGPHNPHMLSVKALTRMQDLSPGYLRRLGSYLETLIWLDRNSSRLIGK